MFLAIKEILHQKTRYAAITLVVFLVSYLVYFLTGLAFGLASSYTEFIDTWAAKTVTVAKDANKSALASRLSTSALPDLPKDAAGVSFAPATVDDRSEGAHGERINIFIAGVDDKLRPKLEKGQWGTHPTEVVIDPTIERAGWHVGDEIELPDATARIVGVSQPARFQASPLILVAGTDISELAGPQARDLTSIIVSGSGKGLPSSVGGVDVETVSVDDFINKLPGYRAQYLTFSLMIGALILILSLVLGIFMYVLTLQKSHVFGVMKAQGVPTGYIARAGAMQTLLISLSGVALGAVAALGSGCALRGNVPFAVSWPLFAALSVAFIVFTLLGSLFPIRVISRIDPMTAIG